MSDIKDLKLRIKEALEAFATGDLSHSALHLLKTLGYSAPRLKYFSKGSFAEFEDNFAGNNERFSKKNAHADQWKSVDVLFQLTGNDLGAQQGIFQNERVDNTIIESYLFFVLELKPKKDNAAYTRTELSQITREVNKCFAMPVMILFKTGDTLSFAVIDRRLHKRESSKDVLEKVTLIKDIRTKEPHRAHIEILFDLGLEQLRKKHDVPNFPKLHEAWRKTLDTKELNKRFFRELSNWYFHAVEVTRWPTDAEPDKDKRNAINTIRLITRLMFVWFLREKDLVPDALFDPRELKKMLRSDAKEKSLYYKAILQNLFFATLNTEMGEKRRFRIEADRSQSKHYFIHNVFRYERCFTDPKATLKNIFAPIPFLNGGLFECLDKQVEQKGKLVPVRIDGFSDRDDNPLLVPDKLFFDPEGEEYDFSEVYGNKKARKEKVRGLIDILSSYKFTITENTPIEEEVALDPELLGKVFENLLANYNPETKTTARKQTGSFYTPREIVNYMVDESLIAYLRSAISGSDDQKIGRSDNGNAVAAKGASASRKPGPEAPVASTHGVDLPSAEDRLRHLLSYTEEQHQFTPKETERLIAAIDNCKILDPACGSGAFPMGVLHKLVHVLHKLDPQNKQWKERQVEKAALLDDADIRERTIADIEDAFANNALDYGRKLYLIENGIYGVDIQPIAMQIAKLRFFISLVVDQRVDAKRANFGVRPLPNLETKFVAANTLMKLEREEANLFTNPAIDKKKAQLKRVRHDYFEARTPQRKAKCREQDKQLREELAALLVEEHELQPKTAKMLAAWDPYDQNASAPFFDPEWMFGLNSGFDIVIGNPPYVSSKGENFTKEFKQYAIDHYVTAKYQIDTYVLFMEAALSLLTKSGVCTYIVPNAWLNNLYLNKVRHWLLTTASMDLLVSMPPNVFEGTAVDTMVFSATNRLSSTDTRIVQLVEGEFKVQKTCNQRTFLDGKNNTINVTASPETSCLLEKLERVAKPLESLCDIARGVGVYHKRVGHTKEFIEKDPFQSDRKVDKTFVPYLRGRHIKPYHVEWTGDSFISYGKWLAEPRDIKYFQDTRVLVRQIPGERLVAVIVEDRFITDQSIFIARVPKDKKQALVLLGLLSSSLLAFYFRNKYSEFDVLFPKLKLDHFKQLPILIPPAKVKAQLEKLVEKRLGLAAGAKAEAVEREIDQVVYGLYGLTEEEIAIVETSVKRKGTKEQAEADE